MLLGIISLVAIVVLALLLGWITKDLNFADRHAPQGPAVDIQALLALMHAQQQRQLELFAAETRASIEAVTKALTAPYQGRVDEDRGQMAAPVPEYADARFFDDTDPLDAFLPPHRSDVAVETARIGEQLHWTGIEGL